MENHPIPQDVTGFKFKLIGSITVKQFLYLLGGGILATIIFILPGNLLLRLPFMAIFGLIGAALAFLPIDGRPMDKMIVNFAKTVPYENQYIFKKKGADIFSFEFFKPLKTHAQNVQEEKTQSEAEIKRHMLYSQFRNSTYRPDAGELEVFKNIKSLFDDSAIKTAVVEEKSPQKILEETRAKEQVQPVQLPGQRDDVVVLQKELQDAQKQLKAGAQSKDLEDKIRDLQARLDAAVGQKEALEKKVIEMGRAKNIPTFKPTPAATPQTPNVRVVSAVGQLQAGFPTLPDIPNIVLGIVKDARGRVLQNILVEVVDKHDIPVRTFKTNALGQFIAATPLPNGTYKISFEDPQKTHEFDAVETTLTGIIVQPLEVISTDQREKLRRELFGN